MKVFVLVAVIAAIIVFGPIITIWSLNTLFGLSIEYNFWTWLAALFIGALVHGRSSKSKD